MTALFPLCYRISCFSQLSPSGSQSSKTVTSLTITFPTKPYSSALTIRNYYAGSGPCTSGTRVPPATGEKRDSSRLTSTTDFFYSAWDSFVVPKQATTTFSLAQQVERIQQSSEVGPDGRQTSKITKTSHDDAVDDCRKQVKAIVNECKRLDRKFRDTEFELEDRRTVQSLGGDFSMPHPPGNKRIEDIFDDPKFVSTTYNAADVVQGSIGDCWFLAALTAISLKEGLIEQLCVEKDEHCGAYGFVFFRDGIWVPVIVDDRLFLRVGDTDKLCIAKPEVDNKRKGEKLVKINVDTAYDSEKLRAYLQKGGKALYYARCKNSDTWLPLLEKAYAKAHGDYEAIIGGSISEGIEDLAGGVAVALNPQDILNKDAFWALLRKVNQTYLFGAATQYESKGLARNHAYTVLEVWESEEEPLRLVRVRCPWGTQRWNGDWSIGSGKWTAEMVRKVGRDFDDDGNFWMTFGDFLKCFATIYYTKLFGPEWTVSQRWTSVNVPRTVEYLDTKFELTLDENGPVAIVLSQPDDRYFRGLQGRYRYSLHFQLCRSTDIKTVLVQSTHRSEINTFQTRSVSAELDVLEAGTYSISVQITPLRDPSGKKAEETIRTFHNLRGKKLLRAGQSFDLAHSRGGLREHEAATRKRLRAEEKERVNNRLRKIRSSARAERKRARKRADRINQRIRNEAERERAEATRGVSKASFSPATEVQKSGAGEIQHGGSKQSDSKDSAELYANVPYCYLPPGDEDFEWDSKIDGYGDESSGDDEPMDLYADDPWNAACVLGLRVYSMTDKVKLEVIKGEVTERETDRKDHDNAKEEDLAAATAFLSVHGAEDES